jgi:hypothetical protein
MTSLRWAAFAFVGLALGTGLDQAAAATFTDGLRIRIFEDQGNEGEGTGRCFTFTQSIVSTNHNFMPTTGAVALIEPEGQPNAGQASGVIRFEIASTSNPVVFGLTWTFNSDLETGALDIPRGAPRIPKEISETQDLTSQFRDTMGRPVTSPFAVRGLAPTGKRRLVTAHTHSSRSSRSGHQPP